MPATSESTKNPLRRTHSGLWYWIVGIFIIAAAIIMTLAIVISRAKPIIRARVIETLSVRFKSKVELDDFNVSPLQGLQVSGKGLRIFGDKDPNNHEPGIQPLIAVNDFRFRTGIFDLLHSPMHVDTVYIKGLQLNLPP